MIPFGPEICSTLAAATQREWLETNGLGGFASSTIIGLNTGFRQHLSDAGLGHVSEIFDGDPPHQPRGCIVQAWSVAELLRAAAALGLVGTTTAE